jgi:CheY-like chemotaxis protein
MATTTASLRKLRPRVASVMSNNDLILVADDNRDCRELLVLTLRMLGFSVASAADGKEALDLAIARRPALIFMDLMMPNMDGYDATSAIHARAETQGIPIVALSANGDEAKYRSKALEAGCIQCLVKPLFVDVLLGLLESVFPNRVPAS